MSSITGTCDFTDEVRKRLEVDIFYLDEAEEGFKVGEKLEGITLYDLWDADTTLAEELELHFSKQGLELTPLAFTDSLGYCHYIKFREVER